MLDLIFHPGGNRGTVDQIHVVSSEVSSLAPPPTREAQFSTSKGIVLGSTVESVERAYGPPTIKASKQGALELIYRCTDRAKCKILADFNRYGFESRFIFIAGKLWAYSIGFIYP